MAKFIDPFCSSCKAREKSCFSRLGLPDLDFLNSNKVTTFYKKGQTIFHAGRQPTGIFCLYNGKIKISKLGFDGKEQIVRFVLSGQLLGIRALLTGRSYMAFASTLEDSTVCYISKEYFFKITEKYPEIKNCMLTTLGQLLEEAEERMTSMAQKPVRERLAESLLFLNNIYNTEENPDINHSLASIILPREDLANIVGTATETVIRLLSEFKAENLISINGRKIILKDIEGLNKIARLQF
ncbi:MAG: Crp/Fnr family transcriptional regulator [Bacteroidales bacterium]|nr:Crp/Fnr family transcriptional regulator [Bacteroidales bacterium]